MLILAQKGIVMDYQQFAEQHNAAYAAFTAIYEQKNPPPQKVKLNSENMLLKALLVLLMISSMTVSGSRTVPEFGGNIVGVAAFFMLELGIIVYPFLRTTLYYDDTKHQSIKKILTIGKWLALVVVVAANLHHMFTSNGLHIPGTDEIMITALSIGAPILAFIAGDAFGALMVRDNHRQKKADEEYNAENKSYHEELNSIWGRQQKAWGVNMKVEKEVVPLYQPVTVTALPASRERKPSVQMEKAKAWLLANEGNLKTSSRDLQPIIGVSHMTIFRAQQELLSVEVSVE